MEGKHREHNVLPLDDSQDFVKTILEARIEALERDTHILEDVCKEARIEVERIQSTKKYVKERIHGRFNEIRELLKEKETVVMNAVENMQLEKEVESLASESNRILESLSLMLTKGKSFLDGWGSVKMAPKVINMVSSIVSKTDLIKGIEDTCNKVCAYESFPEIDKFENEIKSISQSIEKLNRVEFKKIPYTPKHLSFKNVGYFFVSLEWSENRLVNDDDKYIIAMNKDGTAWDPNSTFKCSDNKLSITTLEADTIYKFSVKIKRGELESRWSNVLKIKTPSASVESITESLKCGCNDVEICIKCLEKMNDLTIEGKRKNTPIGITRIIINVICKL